MRDWSSDVVASDRAAAAGSAAEHLDVEAGVHDLGERHELLLRIGPVAEVGDGALLHLLGRRRVDRAGAFEGAVGVVGRLVEARGVDALDASELRSEERRVGKEGVSPCRSRWATYP